VLLPVSFLRSDYSGVFRKAYYSSALESVFEFVQGGELILSFFLVIYFSRRLGWSWSGVEAVFCPVRIHWDIVL
jgi:hypothetical protein